MSGHGGWSTATTERGSGIMGTRPGRRSHSRPVRDVVRLVRDVVRLVRDVVPPIRA